MQKFKQIHSEAEIVKINDNYFIVIPDKVLSLEDLLKSKHLSDALRQEINNVLKNKGTLRTVYRNAIINEYSYHYKSVNFSINKGIKRKLLLGNKRKQPLKKEDLKRLGNNRLPYSELGAYLIVKALNKLNTEQNLNNHTYWNEYGIQHYIFTRFEWYKLIISNPNLMSKKFSADELDTSIISELKWNKINQNYINDKKKFYNKIVNSFLNRLAKDYEINAKEKIIGLLLNTADEKNITDIGYLVSGNKIILKDIVQKEIKAYEIFLLKELGLKKYNVIYGAGKTVDKYNSMFSKFISKKYKLEKIWMALSIEKLEMPNEYDVKDKLKIIKASTDDILLEVVTAVENDWIKNLNIMIVNYRENSEKYEYPFGYYNQILNSIVYPYLDSFYSSKPFDKSQAIEILTTYFNENNDNIEIPEELLELGVITPQDVIRQLDDLNELYAENIASYSALTKFKMLLLK